MILCPLCGSEYNSITICTGGYSYRKCAKCSLVFLDVNTAFDDKELYTLEYIEQRGHNMLGSYLAKAKEATADYYLSLIGRYVNKGKLLEIGCSTGITLKAAQKKGWDVYGVEINKTAGNIAKNLLNVDTIKIGSINDEMFPDDFFSVIIIFDVIEHISNPIEFMRILRNKLKNKGVVLFITPNVSSLSARIFKHKWLHLFREHVCIYSPQTMELLLNRSGFEALKIHRAVKFINMDIIKRHIECHPDIFFKPLLSFFKKLSFLNRIILPFNMGEICIVAQKTRHCGLPMTVPFGS